MANLYGNLDDIVIYLTGLGEFMRIAEGEGDNLTDVDIANGNVDYVYYTTYTLHWGDTLQEFDGGMMMLRNEFGIEYPNTDAGKAKLIRDVLDFHYGNCELDFIEIENNN